MQISSLKLLCIVTFLLFLYNIFFAKDDTCCIKLSSDPLRVIEIPFPSWRTAITCCFVVKSNGAEIKRELKNIDSFPRYRGISITRTVERNSKPSKFVKVKLT